MEQFVTTVRNLSGSGSFHELVEFTLKASDLLSRSPPGVLSAALETLDIQQHSLGVLAILTASLQQSHVVEWEDLYNRVSVFVQECNGEQVRYNSSGFAELCHLFADQLIQRKCAIAGIPALLKAIAKIQLKDTSLTSVHSDVCKLCLVSKYMNPAVGSLLKVDYVDMVKEAVQDPKRILLFYYYGGMILTALKEYEDGLYYFEACCTFPAIAISHVMLEAYKKFVLVSLIVHGDKAKGESVVLPKCASPVINKYIKPLCQPYHDLVNAYYSNKLTELESVMAQYSDMFESDGNSGLVAQAASSQTKSNIKRLTKTFVTLSLEDVAARVGLPSPKDAEREIFAMIRSGAIHARISQKDGMVRFDTNPERFDTVRMLGDLEKNVKSCISLNNQIAQMDEEILLNHHFIKKAVMGTGSMGSPAAGGAASAAAAAVAAAVPAPGTSMGPLGGGGGGGGGGIVADMASSAKRASDEDVGARLGPGASSSAAASGASSSQQHLAPGPAASAAPASPSSSFPPPATTSAATTPSSSARGIGSGGGGGGPFGGAQQPSSTFATSANHISGPAPSSSSSTMPNSNGHPAGPQ